MSVYKGEFLMRNISYALGNLIFRILIIGVIVFLLGIIGISIKQNVIGEKNTRSISTTGTISDNTPITEEDSNIINPDKILDAIKRANGKSIEDAYTIYKEERQSWNSYNQDIAELLIKYFDSYFELRLAIFFCIDHNKTINDVIKLKNNKLVKGLENTKIGDKVLDNFDAMKVLLENEFYKNNPYLNGDKTFNKGLDDCITYIADLERYMQKNKGIHVEIPAVDLIKTAYQYICEADEKNTDIQFVNLSRNYETAIIKNIHESHLSEKDVLVLELKVAYLLMQITNEKKSSKLDKDCTDIMDEIDLMTENYTDDIGEKGVYKPTIRFFKRIKDTASKIQVTSAKGNLKEEQKGARGWLQDKNNIPYMN